MISYQIRASENFRFEKKFPCKNFFDGGPDYLTPLWVRPCLHMTRGVLGIFQWDKQIFNLF